MGAELAIGITLPRRTFDVELATTIGPDDTLALVGPSGAGKSSMLRAIAGLDRPAAGRVTFGQSVWFDHETGVNLAPERRSVGLVFQEYALFPHMSVAENVAFGAPGDIRDVLDRLAVAHLASAKPDTLSGGERQRVAVARALARQPGVLLLDEPTAALDSHTRDGVRSELRQIIRAASLPTLVVTHDFEEASMLARRVAVVERGVVVQEGAPDDLVARPASSFVASLTGANVILGHATAAGRDLTRVTIDEGGTIFATGALTGSVAAIVRPTEVSLGRDVPTDSAMNHVQGVVASIVRLGGRVRIRVGPLTAEVTEDSAARLAFREGDVATATFKATATRVVTLGLLDPGHDGTP